MSKVKSLVVLVVCCFLAFQAQAGFWTWFSSYTKYGLNHQKKEVASAITTINTTVRVNTSSVCPPLKEDISESSEKLKDGKTTLFLPDFSQSAYNNSSYDLDITTFYADNCTGSNPILRYGILVLRSVLHQMRLFPFKETVISFKTIHLQE